MPELPAKKLPALVGSEKQIKWADRIRADYLSRLDKPPANPEDTTAPSLLPVEVRESIRAGIFAMLSAKWWIDHKDQTVRKLADQLAGTFEYRPLEIATTPDLGDRGKYGPALDDALKPWIAFKEAQKEAEVKGKLAAGQVEMFEVRGSEIIKKWGNREWIEEPRLPRHFATIVEAQAHTMSEEDWQEFRLEVESRMVGREPDFVPMYSVKDDGTVSLRSRPRRLLKVEWNFATRDEAFAYAAAQKKSAKPTEDQAKVLGVIPADLDEPTQTETTADQADLDEQPATIDLVLDLDDEAVNPSNLPAVVGSPKFSDRDIALSGLTHGQSPVVYHRGLWNLIPKRSDEKLAEFRDSLASQGIRDAVWVAKIRTPGAVNTTAWAIVEGNQRVLIAAALDLPIKFRPIPLTDPADPVKVLAEAREFALRANYRDRPQYTDQNKSESIRRLYLDEAKHGFARAGLWVADILGCSQPLVSKTLAKMRDAGEFDAPPQILTRTGKLIANSALTLKAKVVEAVVETPPEPDDVEGVDLGPIDGTEPDDELDDESVDGTEVDEVEEPVENPPEPVKLGPIDGFRYRGAKTSYFVNFVGFSPRSLGPLYNGEPWYHCDENQWYRAIPGGKEKIAGPYQDASGNWTLTEPTGPAAPWQDENGSWHHADGAYASPAEIKEIEATQVDPHFGALYLWLERLVDANGGLEALDAKLNQLETFDEVDEEVARLAAALTIGKADEVPEPVKVETRRNRKQTAKV